MESLLGCIVDAPPLGKLFGVDLDEVLSRFSEQGNEIPLVVSKIMDFLELECLKVEGIFRIPGDVGKVQELKRYFDGGTSCFAMRRERS